MKIKIEHQLGKEEAKKRIDKLLLEALNKKAPHGFDIKNPSAQWSEDVLNLSVQVKKGFIGVKIKGSATVNEADVIIDVDIPAIISSFVKEEEIRQMVEREGLKLLS